MNNSKHDDARSTKINNIRAKARGITVEQLLSGTCPTCCRPADAPFRRYSTKGTIEHGCIDSHHAGRLIGESARWHSRPAAQELRAKTMASLA